VAVLVAEEEEDDIAVEEDMGCMELEEALQWLAQLEELDLWQRNHDSQSRHPSSLAGIVGFDVADTSLPAPCLQAICDGEPCSASSTLDLRFLSSREVCRTLADSQSTQLRIVYPLAKLEMGIVRALSFVVMSYDAESLMKNAPAFW
jgi:hypothetical protein